MNNNLVIPAAGKSSRYPNVKPKYLLTHPDGSLMIQKVLSAFDKKDYDKTVITLLREHCEKFDADTVINQVFGSSVEVCILEEPTADPAETVIKTIQDKSLTGFVTIKDCDCYVDAPVLLSKNCVVGKSVYDLSEETTIKNKSFIKKNEDEIISDIVEKKVISDKISLGVYCMNIDDFQNAYNVISNSHIYKFKGEMYISHIVSFLINQGSIFHYVEAEKYFDWGTISEWRKEQKRFTTYFFDIDGVFLENAGKYGKKNWKNFTVPIEENMRTLKKLSDEGAQIFFVTSRDKENIEQFKKILKKFSIKYEKIIWGCNHSQRVIVNDFAPTNPFPSCKSISIPRNGKLSGYVSND